MRAAPWVVGMCVLLCGCRGGTETRYECNCVAYCDGEPWKAPLTFERCSTDPQTIQALHADSETSCDATLRQAGCTDRRCDCGCFGVGSGCGVPEEAPEDPCEACFAACDAFHACSDPCPGIVNQCTSEPDTCDCIDAFHREHQTCASEGAACAASCAGAADACAAGERACREAVDACGAGCHASGCDGSACSCYDLCQNLLLDGCPSGCRNACAEGVEACRAACADGDTCSAC